MSKSDIDSVTEQLGKTSVHSESEISFAGKGQKLDSQEDAGEITQEIEKCSNLTTLRLEDIILGEEAAQTIGESLAEHAEFERALWNNIFSGGSNSDEIPHVLRYLGSGIMTAGARLTELDLSENVIGANGLEGLTDLLKSSSCYRLRALKLNNSGLGVDGGKVLAECLLECHKNSSGAGTPLDLRVFACGRARLGNDGTAALAEAFKVMGTLEEVSMPQNGINSKVIAVLADAFTQNPNLRIIDISNNPFLAEGAEIMATILPHLKKLEEINFNGCLIQDTGAEDVAKGITDNRCLKRLFLTSNDLTLFGARAVVNVMLNKTSLESLDLNGNQLGKQGIAEVKDLMGNMDKEDQLGSFSQDDVVSSDSEDEEDIRVQPSLNSSDIGSLTDQLAKTTVDAKLELDFAGCGLKLNTEADGNQLGEQGIAEVKDLMGNMDKKDQLGSFSQDDVVSSDSEDEEDIRVQPSLNSSDIGSLTDQLAKTTVDAKLELDFAGCGLKLNTEADAAEITKKIDSCPSLSALRLEGNTLGVEAAKAIGDSLAKHPEFERALWSDMFTGRLKSEIPGALRHLGSGIMTSRATLTELDLSDNAFGPNGMEGLTDLLKSSSCYRLRALKLNNNGLGIHGGKMLADCLLECHKRGLQAGTPLQLRVFVSGRGRLENDGAKALAEAFKVMGSLEEVSMPQNGINSQGIAALAAAFAQNTNLRVINMNDNTFTAAGARSMAEALPHLTKLEEINFGDCLVRNEGAEVLAQALKDGHQRLKRLVLSFNEIKESGANAIAYAMANKPDLEKLDLDGNQLGEEGIEFVCATMESVDKLDLLGSFSDDEGLDSEEEEDDDEEEDEEEEEEEEREVSRDIQTVSESPVRDVTLTPHQDKTVTTKDFLLFPSPSKLKALGSHRVDDIVKYLEEDLSDVDRAIDVFMKVSCIVVPDDEQTSKAACDCADAIFCTLFRSADASPPGVIANSILVHLGLIKSEDKKFKPVSKPDGVLHVLEHAVQQDYFLKGVRDILQIFISRPHPALIDSHQSRKNLLNALAKC